MASGAALALLGGWTMPARAQDGSEVRAELSAARAEIAQQREQLSRQEERLRALEERLAATAPVTAVASASPPQTIPVAGQGATVPIEQVGQAPAQDDRRIELAVLGEQGSAITKAGQLSVEGQLEYARADRNRAIFRGIELIESLLVGVFDINESRQDVVTASTAFRYGLSNRLEIGARVPFVYRSDKSVLTPIQGSTASDPAATIDNSANGKSLGDIELSARYQLTAGRGGSPYLIANLQGVIPTGKGPFDVPRDANGRALRAATGAGFYGISPSITAVLPSDPVVLFGSLGYTKNFKKNVDTRIPPIIIEAVDPGDAISISAGIGIAFNERTSLNLGYAHSWSFGTLTRTRLIDPGPNDTGPVTRKSRDLQAGRLLLGVSYRVNDRTTVNWSVEAGATDDATDLRTVLRIPFVLLAGK